METLPFRVHFPRFLAVLLAALPAHAAPREIPRSAPPQPLEQSVSVKRGQRVDIPLRIYGTRAQTLSWIIRQRPAHGKLTDLRSTGQESALITYTPASEVSSQADRFTFSVRSNEGVSAPAEVLITIVDAKPRLTVTATLDFGTSLVGEQVQRSLEFTNSGGGLAEGEILVDPPWRLASAPRYKLGDGESATAKLIFAPEKPGAFESDFRFTSQTEQTCTLRGLAEEPLSVSPAALVLVADAKAGERSAEFKLSNQTGEPLEVTIIASQRLALPNTVTVPPRDAVPLVARVAEDDVASIDENVRFAAGNYLAQLSVKSPPLPARVMARPASVSFRKPRSPSVESERLVLGNSGGVVAELALATQGPFTIQESWVALQPGEQKEIAVTAGGSATNGRGVLKVSGAGVEVAVPLEINTASAPVVSALRKASNVSARAPTLEARDPDAATSAGGIPPAVNQSVEQQRAVFTWPGQLPEKGKLRCRVRTLSLDQAGRLVTSFADYQNCTFAQAGPNIAATVEKLTPGKLHFFRVDLDPGAGEASSPLTFTSVQTPAAPPRPAFFTPLRLLIAGALVCGLLIARQRRQARAAP